MHQFHSSYFQLLRRLLKTTLKLFDFYLLRLLLTLQYLRILKMITDNNSISQRQQRQTNLNFKDLQMGQRIKKVTTHDLFQLKRNQQNYVAKLFRPEFRHNYELQLGILRLLKHQNIIELVHFQSAGSETMGLWNCDMLILKQADKGSLNDYIPLNGRISQSVARVIFTQIISALKYASQIQPNGIFHPNLLPSNILLDKYRQVKVCGWSKENESKVKAEFVRHMLFSCCQILILMITSYMPFFKKNSASDPLFKFIKPGHMSKFWQALQKRVSSKSKSFSLTGEVKQLIQNVFLSHWTTFEQIQQCAWMKKNAITKQQYNGILQKLETQSKERRENNTKKLLEKQQKKRQILREYQLETLRGSSSRSSGEYDFFIQDFYDNFYSKQDVPASQCSELIRLYDDRPNFVIASLKEHLRDMNDNDINLIFGGQFKLENYSVQKHDSQAYVELKFSQINSEQMNEDQVEEIEIKIKALIRFFKNNNNYLFAEVKIIESNLCEYYATLVMSFIEDKIRQFVP